MENAVLLPATLPRAPLDRVVFQPTVASLFARLPASAITPELKRELVAVGLDLDRPLQVAYPMAVWIAVLARTARSAFPNDPTELAHRKLGQRLIDGYVETAIGRAAFAFLKLIGPRRTLERTAKAFRNGNNYCEARVTERRTGAVEVWMNEVGTEPSFIAGILEAGLTHIGAPHVVVDVEGTDSTGMTFLVTWG